LRDDVADMLIRTHPLDVLVVVVLVVAAVSGWRRGFTVVVLGYAGLLIGLAVGAWAATRIGLVVSTEESLRRIFVGLGVFFLVAAIFHSLAIRAGRAAKAAMIGQWTSGVDSLGGALVASAVAAIALWFVALTMSDSMPVVAKAVNDSVVLTVIDRHAPRPPAALSELRRLLAASPFPDAFASLRPPMSSGPPPGVHLTAAGLQRARTATVQVASEGCGGLLFGSGFPVRTDLVVTNAHVVAGTANHRVITSQGTRLPATVVLFDPRRDVALLRVPGLGLRPLALAEPSGPRATGAVVGYPGGGRQKVVGAQVVSRVNANGRDIYSRALVNREIWVLRSTIRKGDSGGPLVDRNGRSLGVVFAASTSTDQEGYALTNAELRPDLVAAAGRTAPVRVLGCAG
jgi:S1-C subfamily serine protease